MLAAVLGLGFRPHVATVSPRAQAATETRGTDRSRAATMSGTHRHPEPVATALRQAKNDGRLVLIDFFAAWCAPCIALEKNIFPHPRIQEILKGYRLVRVDVDDLPEVARHYQVAAMPTLVVLDPDGRERQRLVGIMTVERLARALAPSSPDTADAS